MNIINKASYEDWKAKQTDGYGRTTFQYAEKWADMMEDEMTKGEKIKDIADRLSHEADVFDISGFMYGVAVQILTHHWVHGDALRTWHNQKYGHNGDGVVNPALLQVKKT